MGYADKDYKDWLSGLDLLYLGAVREYLVEDNQNILDIDDIRYLRECRFRYTPVTMELILEDVVDARGY